MQKGHVLGVWTTNQWLCFSGRDSPLWLWATNWAKSYQSVWKVCRFINLIIQITTDREGTATRAILSYCWCSGKQIGTSQQWPINTTVVECEHTVEFSDWPLNQNRTALLVFQCVTIQHRLSMAGRSHTYLSFIPPGRHTDSTHDSPESGLIKLDVISGGEINFTTGWALKVG